MGKICQTKYALGDTEKKEVPPACFFLQTAQYLKISRFRDDLA
jgi:hypothetical protein